jgi:hypothetical protein
MVGARLHQQERLIPRIVGGRRAALGGIEIN